MIPIRIPIPVFPKNLDSDFDSSSIYDRETDSKKPGFDSDSDSSDTGFSPKRKQIWVICIFGSSSIPDHYKIHTSSVPVQYQFGTSSVPVRYQFGTSVDLTIIIIVKSSPVTDFAIGRPTRGGTSREHVGRVSGT